MRMLPVEIWIYLPHPPHLEQRWKDSTPFSIFLLLLLFSTKWGKKGTIIYFSVSLWILLSAVLGRLQTIISKAPSPQFFCFSSRVKCGIELCKGRLLGLGFLYQFCHCRSFYVLLYSFLLFYFCSLLHSLLLFWLSYLLWSL